MKILLLSLPGLSPFIPPLSLICLNSYLRKNKIESLCCDTAVEFLNYYLQPERLFKKIDLSKKILREEKTPAEKYQNYSQIFNETLSKIKDYKKRIKKICCNDKINISKKCFEEDIKTINDLIVFSSVSNYPNIISLCGEFNTAIYENLENSIYYDYYKNEIINEIFSVKPDIIGISISFYTQINPYFQLVNIIKKNFNIPIVTGGAFFSGLFSTFFQLSDNIYSVTDDKIGNIISYLNPFGVIGEGEEALLELCQNINDVEYLKKIPGLVYYDKIRNKIIINRKKEIIDVNKLPVLDLTGIPLGKKYFSPFISAPLLTNRGCYWSKCSFCVHADILDKKFRELPYDTVEKSLLNYKNNYDVTVIPIYDEAISPKMLKKLTGFLKNNNIKVYFGSMARLEKKFEELIKPASEAGMIMLSFGMESANQRIINLMNKGFEADTAQKLLDICYDNGVLVELNIILGFPSETKKEISDTVEFLVKNAEKIGILRLHIFMLNKGSRIYENPDLYGIKILPEQPDEEFFILYNSDKGLSNDDVVEIFFELSNNPLFKDKLIDFFEKFHNEEYYTIKYLIKKEENINL
ncbi:radical SAM protein [Candidatus Dependentiae bacterium]|nr:radical SAM protein [Candidatus Dependentiae bacterium]